MEGAEAPLVVIIEDDDFSAFLFEQVLTAHGYAVAVNRGDERSLPALLSLRPSALIVDLHLGEIDGLQLLRRIRDVRSLRQVPAAVITGDYFTDARVSRELEALGIEMYLKPLWDEDLLRVVGTLVKRRGPAQSPAEPGTGQRPRDVAHP